MTPQPTAGRKFLLRCRECGREGKVRAKDKNALVRAIDAARYRCAKCGGRLIER